MIENLDTVKFQFEDVVYRKVEPSVAGMVTGILFRPHGVVYLVAWATGGEDERYDIELTKDKSFGEVAK